MIFCPRKKWCQSTVRFRRSPLPVAQWAKCTEHVFVQNTPWTAQARVGKCWKFHRISWDFMDFVRDWSWWCNRWFNMGYVWVPWLPWCFSMFFHVFPILLWWSWSSWISFPSGPSAGGNLRDVAVKIQHPGVIDSAFMDLNIVPQRRNLGEIWCSCEEISGDGEDGTPFPTDLGLKFFTV